MIWISRDYLLARRSTNTFVLKQQSKEISLQLFIYIYSYSKDIKLIKVDQELAKIIIL